MTDLKRPMSGLSQPPSSPTRRFRAVYEQPAPAEFDVELPDDIEGPEDLRQFLLDEAPFSREKAIRVEAVSRGGPFLPHGGALERLNPLPEGGDTREPAQRDLRADLVQALAADMDPVAFAPYDCDEPPDPRDRYGRQAAALEFAERLARAGWRRVTEDPETVERVAKAMWVGPPEWEAGHIQRLHSYAETWRAKARAALSELHRPAGGVS